MKIYINFVEVVSFRTDWRPIGARRIGRPMLRWKDKVREYRRKITIQNWNNLVVDRAAW